MQNSEYDILAWSRVVMKARLEKRTFKEPSHIIQAKDPELLAGA